VSSVSSSWSVNLTDSQADNLSVIFPEFKNMPKVQGIPNKTTTISCHDVNGYGETALHLLFKDRVFQKDEIGYLACLLDSATEHVFGREIRRVLNKDQDPTSLLIPAIQNIVISYFGWYCPEATNKFDNFGRTPLAHLVLPTSIWNEKFAENNLKENSSLRNKVLDICLYAGGDPLVNVNIAIPNHLAIKAFKLDSILVLAKTNGFLGAYKTIRRFQMREYARVSETAAVPAVISQKNKIKSSFCIIS
jgi:hypothetical protein